MPATETAGKQSPITSEPGLLLSVVLPVLNEERDLGVLLDQLQEQTSVPGEFEVLVVDGGSTDGTRELVLERGRSWKSLHLLNNPKRRSGPARNIGARAAQGQYLLYLDGHCLLPRKDYLARVVAIFEESEADCLCRPQPLNQLQEEGWSGPISKARHSPFGHNPGSDIYADQPGYTDPESAGASYRLEVFRELGGYDERFDACEDVEFNHRVSLGGYRSYRHPDLAVAYRPRYTLSGLFKQMLRYGRGRARLMARHPRMAPWVLIGLTAATLFLIAITAITGNALWPVLAVSAYGALSLFMASRPTDDVTTMIRTALVFPVIHSGLLFGFWRGLLESLYFSGPQGKMSTEHE